MIDKAASDKTQISAHNVVHPYCFTRDMLTGMRVLRQLDDKFIVGVVLQEGEAVTILFVNIFNYYDIFICYDLETTH